MSSKRLAHGTFCWVELNTADADAAKTFYTSLMGWETRDEPGAPGLPYTLFLLGEDQVAGMAPLPSEMQTAIPNHWRSYVAVESADETAEKIVELGGELMGGEPFDAHDAGRMAIAKDPQGAPFAIWQAKRHAGADRFNDPGCQCWNELFTTDVEAAQRFYGELFGWTTRASQTDGPLYYEWQHGERAAGGMMQIQPEWGPIPPHWNVYFTVADLAATLAKSKELGGRLMMARKIDVGEFAMIDDPQGAGFTVIEMEPGKADGQPPRRE